LLRCFLIQTNWQARLTITQTITTKDSSYIVTAQMSQLMSQYCCIINQSL
jgi:hypothetical protein